MSELAGETGEVVEVPGESGEDVWSGPSQEEWQQTQADLAQARELVQAVQQARGAQEGPLSGYDPEFRQELDQYLEQKLSPYQSFQEEARMREGEEVKKDIFHDLSVRDGEFDVDMADLRYSQKFAPMMIQKYGLTPKAAEEAIKAAADEQRAYESQVRAAAVEQYQNQLRGITSAPRDAAVNGTAAAGVHVSPPGATELDIVKHYFPTAR